MMLPALIVLCAVSVGAYLYIEAKEKKMPALLCKGLASLCFVLIGLIYRSDLYVSDLIFCGLLFGCIADVLVGLRYIFRKIGQQLHLTGILFFLAGHIAYLIATLSLSDNWPICIMAGIIISIFFYLWIYKRIIASITLRIVGVIYIGIITFLNTSAIGNLILNPGTFTALFAFGAVLFLASDILLILNTFGPKHKRNIRIIHLSLYYLGQVLIALSLTFF